MKVFIFGGEKGGVGKTIACVSFIEAQHAASNDPLILDCDSTNPDIHSKYKTRGAQLMDPSSLQAWGDVLEQASSRDVVINLPARGLETLATNAEIIAETAVEQSVQLVYFHILNRQKESLFLLAEVIESIGGFASITAVRNLYFGAADKFTFFNSSPARKKVSVVDFPELQDWVADRVMTAAEGEGVASILPTLAALDRAALKRWLRATGEIWTPCF